MKSTFLIPLVANFVHSPSSWSGVTPALRDVTSVVKVGAFFGTIPAAIYASNWLGSGLPAIPAASWTWSGTSPRPLIIDFALDGTVTARKEPEPFVRRTDCDCYEMYPVPRMSPTCRRSGQSQASRESVSRPVRGSSINVLRTGGDDAAWCTVGCCHLLTNEFQYLAFPRDAPVAALMNACGRCFGSTSPHVKILSDGELVDRNVRVADLERNEDGSYCVEITAIDSSRRRDRCGAS